MKGLIPKEKLFYLPYSRTTVPMIYCDAREVNPFPVVPVRGHSDVSFPVEKAWKRSLK